MKHIHRFLFFICILLSTIFIQAASLQTDNESNNRQKQTYASLLSNAYNVVVKYEQNKGTFSNIDYFTTQAKNVSDKYNPRPLKINLRNIRPTNYSDLKLERLTLTRFMNGYAGRIAQNDVAMMHASFDCRIKNIKINYTIDKECKNLFEKHQKLANKAVDRHLNRQDIIKKKNIKDAMLTKKITNKVTEKNIKSNMIFKVVSMAPITKKSKNNNFIQKPTRVSYKSKKISTDRKSSQLVNSNNVTKNSNRKTKYHKNYVEQNPFTIERLALKKGKKLPAKQLRPKKKNDLRSINYIKNKMKEKDNKSEGGLSIMGYIHDSAFENPQKFGRNKALQAGFDENNTLQLDILSDKSQISWNNFP